MSYSEEDVDDAAHIMSVMYARARNAGNVSSAVAVMNPVMVNVTFRTEVTVRKFVTKRIYRGGNEFIDNERSAEYNALESDYNALESDYNALESDYSIMAKKSKQSRTGTQYPNEISQVLNSWVRSHTSYPYPTEAEKVALCEDTGLTVVQINNWMSNARRRKLKVRGKKRCRLTKK